MSFVIAAMPAYNEERSIAKMVLGCKKYVDQVVVVDDGSSDATASIAEALGAYVVRHEKNSGYGAALRSCFETARNLGAEKMVIIDSDGQHDAAEIPKLLVPLNNGCDLVIGSRFCDGNGENIPAYRKVGMKVLDMATNVAGGASVTDSQSGFRAYGQRAIESIYIQDSDMSAGSEVLLQAKDNDMELRRPLYYFTVPGILLTAVGVGMGLDFLRVFYHGGSLAYGPTLLMILLTLVGSFLAMTGIILHSISKMMIEFKAEIEQIKRANNVHGHNTGNKARDN
jgi:glycosyltransferase involved in cell wall biosynthesis